MKKEEFLKLKYEIELGGFEDKKCEELYNKILFDPDMKEHLFKILKRNPEISGMLNENVINNILMINWVLSIDDFDEKEI